MRARSVFVGIVVATSLAFGSSGGASATFVGSTPTVSGSISTGTLAAPTAVAAARGTCAVLTSTAVNVSWTATASTFADGYQILRSTTSGSGYVSVGSVGGRTTTAFTDTTVSFLTTYYYVVRATKLAWLSGNSNEASVTTPTPLCV